MSTININRNIISDNYESYYEVPQEDPQLIRNRSSGERVADAGSALGRRVATTGWHAARALSSAVGTIINVIRNYNHMTKAEQISVNVTPLPGVEQIDGKHIRLEALSNIELSQLQLDLVTRIEEMRTDLMIVSDEAHRRLQAGA